MDPVFKINLSNVVKNYNLINKKIGKCGAVVKCNAYGFGALQVVKKLISETNCRDFFVSNLEEAFELKNVVDQYNGKLYIFNGFTEKLVDVIWDANFIPVCFNKEQINIWRKKCDFSNISKPIVIQIETGLNRMGLSIEKFNELNLGDLNIEFLLSHMACGYQNDEMNELQFSIINKIQNYKKSIASSCAMILDNKYYGDISRIGRFLYGSNEDAKDLFLHVVGTLTARIINVQNVKNGEYIGYCRNYQAKKDMVIAIVNVGYGDGCGCNGFVHTNGHYAEILSYSMDYIIIDITNIDIKNDLVEIIGKNVNFDMIAKNNHHAKGFEMTCNLGRRIKKEYVE